MNYEITNLCITEKAASKLHLKQLLLLILSTIFIPAAYVYAAAMFISKLLSKKASINKNLSSLLIYAYMLIGLTASDYKLVSAFFVLLIFLCCYSYNLFSTAESDCLDAVIRLFYLVSMVIFFIGILQYINPDFTIPSKWISNSYSVNKRIYSTFFNPNVFGFYINFIILLSIERLNFKKPGLELIMFSAGIFCLFLTFSRTSWISVVSAIIITSLFNRKRLKYALIISLVIFCLDVLLGTGRANPSNAVADSSFLYRIEVWKACIEIIKDNFISGIGFGTLSKHIAGYSNVVSTGIEHSHSIYLQVFTETGILGFSLFTILLLNIIKFFKNNLFKKHNSHLITAFSVFVMTMIHGLVDSVPLTPQIMMILSIYAGIICSLNTFERSNKNIKSLIY